WALALSSICTMAEPSATLSPTLTSTAFTTPDLDAGISMEALSDSTVIRLCSTEMVSPTATSTSITSTSEKSPISGTFSSVVLMMAPIAQCGGSQPAIRQDKH